MKKMITVAIAGMVFAVVALTSFASAADVINQNIGSAVATNAGHVNVNALNLANAGPGSIVNQTISQVALSKFSDYYKMPPSVSQSASNVANAGAGSTVNQQISQVALSKSSTTKKVPPLPSASESKTNHIKSPKRYDIENKIPITVYFGYQMQPVPYAQYQAIPAYKAANSLWIQGTTSWTEYTLAPQGSSLSLLAISSAGGNGYLYEINPDGTLSKENFYFFPGSSQMGFHADTIGQHILLFVIDDQVSSSVVIDVVPYVQPYQNPVPIPSYPQGTIYPPNSVPVVGDTRVTIVSEGMRGYQVFLDGNYVGIEGTGGDPLDGRFSFNVMGNQNHEVDVYDGQFNYPKTMYFQRGVPKIIYVEPGTAGYA